MNPGLYRLIANAIKLPPEKITPDLAMSSCSAWDSLAHMDLIVSLEERFGVTLSPDEIVAMTSVGEIERILKNKGVLSECN